MDVFTSIDSRVTPLDKTNVDTDQIIPKQFLKLITKSGFGKFLFYDWRYDGNGNKRPEFILNDARYDGSRILVAGDNFGCGSSREHAVWALSDYGFAVIIAPSFADIFLSNCFKNGILPISLDQRTVDKLLREAGPVHVDLGEQTITTSSGVIHFEIVPFRKKILVEGLDDIAQTLQFEDHISEFEKRSMVPSVL